MHPSKKQSASRYSLLPKRHVKVQLPFSQVIVLLNPASTHAKQSMERIGLLEDICGKDRVTVIKTAKEGAAANRQLLRDNAHLLGPRTILCVAAGDGTVSLVIETLVTDKAIPDEARRTPVLPLWGGNANDLAHMLNGVYSRQHLYAVFERGQIIAIHPLACTLREPRKKPVERIAACYASFGATAFAAAKLNEPEHRNHPLHRLPGGRFLKELLTGFSALMEAPTFHIREEGQLKVVYERTFLSGSRFAKIGRLPFKLTDDVFYFSSLGDKRLFAILPRLLRFLQKRFADRFMRSHAHFTVQETTLAQFDGEHTRITAGTKVTVELSSQPFYTVSTLLADSNGTTKQ